MVSLQKRNSKIVKLVRTHALEREMKLIALTGGISCGKSSVVNILSTMENVVIIDADLIARNALNTNEEPYKQLEQFIRTSNEYSSHYNDIFNHQQESEEDDKRTVNRVVLGSLVFKDNNLRRKLNSFTHGWIFKIIVDEIWKEYKSSSSNDDKVVVLDQPLFFETKIFKYIVSKVIVVTTSDENQKQWLMKRNNLSEEEAMNRIKAQMPNSEKEKLTDYIIRNDSDLESLKQQTETIFEECKKSATSVGWIALSALTGFKAYSQFL
jgi:dephospho-CoA kinase